MIVQFCSPILTSIPSAIIHPRRLDIETLSGKTSLIRRYQRERYRRFSFVTRSPLASPPLYHHISSTWRSMRAVLRTFVCTKSAPLLLSKIILISKAGIYEAPIYNSISVEYRNTLPRLWNRAFRSFATTPTVRPVYTYTSNKPINRIKSGCMNFVRLHWFVPCDSYERER